MPDVTTDRLVIASPIATSALSKHLHDAEAAPRGEGANSVTRLVGALLTRGVPVTVATCTRELSPGEEVIARGDLLTIRYGCWRGGPAARDLFRVERDHVRDVVRAEGVNLVNAHWTYEYALGGLDSGVPTLVTARDWGPRVLRHETSPYRAARLLMQMLALRRADHVMANSPYLAQQVRRVTRSDVPVIGNPIDEAMFGPSNRADLSSAPVLVAVNQGWGRLKNVTALIDAMAEIRRAVPGVTLRLLGDGQESGGPAEAHARDRGLLDGIEFIGRVSPAQVLTEMRGADAFVHVALEESFGNVLIEAMAQATPVVGGRRSGAVPWVLDDGRAGVLVDVTDPAAIAAGVIGLVTDADRWHQFSQAGRARAWTTFRSDQIAAAYEGLYADVRRLTTIPQN